jgi:glycosyltransferase involved in cell wall biosynthesis
MEPLGVAVVIPVLNEGASIAAVIGEIPRDVVREIIVVDGGSSDGAAEIAAAAGARVIVPGQHGYGRACLAGGAAAAIDCGIIAFMDGDGTDRGDLIARIVEPIRQGEYDFVIASRAGGERESGSMAWHQLLAGHLAGIGMRVLYGVRYTDMCADRAIRRDCLGRLGMCEMTYGWNIKMQIEGGAFGSADTRSADALSAPQRPRIQNGRHRSRTATRGVTHHRDLSARCRHAGTRLPARNTVAAVNRRAPGPLVDEPEPFYRRRLARWSQ